MGFILGILALIPFLSLVPLHWFWTTGSRGGFRKIVFFSFSASVLWSLLAGYLWAVHPKWRWCYYALLLFGMFFSAFCARLTCAPRQRPLRLLIVLSAFPIMFFLTDKFISQATWIKLYDQGTAILTISRFRTGGWR